MKVLLIEPPHTFLRGDGSTRHLLPLGLGHVGGALRGEGHEVRILLPDMRPYRGDDPWGEIRVAIATEQPDVVGVTGMTPSAAPLARVVAEARDALGPEVPIVVGGEHATFQPAAAARIPGVTVCVRSEGELAMNRLCAGWAEQGAAFDALSVPGTVGLREGSVVFGPPPEVPEDLDALPWSLREEFVWDELVHPLLFDSIITMRGCPYTCIYCSLPRGALNRTRFRSAVNIAGEIQHLRDELGATSLTFHDPVFTMSWRRTLELMEELQRRDIKLPFVVQTRADSIRPEVLEAMADRGCARIFFGIETGDEESLRKLKKPMSLDTIRQAVAMTKAAGIDPCGYFMVGFPWEDEVLIRKTVDFALSLELQWVSLHSATPVVGTDLYDMMPPSRQIEVRDFLAGDLNLTQLDDAHYLGLFNELRSRTEAYNLAVGQARFAMPDQGPQPLRLVPTQG